MIKDICLGELEQICKSYFKEALKESGLRSFSFSDHSLAKVFTDREGCPLAILVYRDLGGAVVEIDFIASQARYRRKGAAKALLESINSKKDIWLELKETNLTALMFYEGNGFSQMGRRENYYEDGAAALNMLRKQT